MADDVAAVAAKIRAVMAALPPSTLQHAGECVDEAGTVLYPMAQETHDPELAEAITAMGGVREEIDQAWQICRRVREICERYLNAIGATADAGGAPGNPTQPAPRHAIASDGSHYPQEAAPVIDVLPRRVREKEAAEKTVGYVDGSVTNRFTSGRDQTWTPAILARARSVGLAPRLAAFVSSHVEMKVAAMMLQRGQRHSELVINHVPCGSQPNQPTGCDQVIERFLPAGYTLTVHGTTQTGRPFSKTYKGQA
ncbi:DddA-like double-stranded DNA deaminase toxin [Saccharopolyspora sp. 5N708]|uniref:DddA-like double-stranded DNA deaminase toxin n=1 Tax=Saccharopolyspora sp. 5N708 TaxID=3457424 RepID=UPI003FD24E22